MNEIVKHIQFSVSKRPINNYRARQVFDLICRCINEKTILDDYVLQNWWLEKLVKPLARYKEEYAGKDKEGKAIFKRTLAYDYYKKKIKEFNGLLPGYYWSEAKQTLKYHIGSLVVNGYLVALPIIKLTDLMPNEQEVQVSDTTKQP